MNWRENLEYWPRALPEFEIEPQTTALVIVDIQNYLSRRDCGRGKLISEKFPNIAEYYFPRVNREVLPNNQKLLEFFRKNKLRIIYVTSGPELNDASDFYNPRLKKDEELQKRTGYTTTFVKGTKEHDIHELIRPIAGEELIINKTSIGAFNSTSIDYTLRKLSIESVVITGLITNSCVETTARDAADRCYKTIIVEDACATFDPLAHNGTLRTFARTFGMVKTTKEVIEDLY